MCQSDSFFIREQNMYLNLHQWFYFYFDCVLEDYYVFHYVDNE